MRQKDRWRISGRGWMASHKADLILNHRALMDKHSSVFWPWCAEPSKLQGGGRQCRAWIRTRPWPSHDPDLPDRYLSPVTINFSLKLSNESPNLFPYHPFLDHPQIFCDSSGSGLPTGSYLVPLDSEKKLPLHDLFPPKVAKIHNLLLGR